MKIVIRSIECVDRIIKLENGKKKVWRKVWKIKRDERNDCFRYGLLVDGTVSSGKIMKQYQRIIISNQSNMIFFHYLESFSNNFSNNFRLSFL